MLGSKAVEAAGPGKWEAEAAGGWTEPCHPLFAGSALTQILPVLPAGSGRSEGSPRGACEVPEGEWRLPLPLSDSPSCLAVTA